MLTSVGRYAITSPSNKQYMYNIGDVRKNMNIIYIIYRNEGTSLQIAPL